MESRNKKCEPKWMAEIAIPGGNWTIFLSEQEAIDYNADPDGYAAALHGLTKIEYLQWVDLDGAPLCSHRSKDGDLCPNSTGQIQLGAAEWKALHRNVRCAVHCKKKSK